MNFIEYIGNLSNERNETIKKIEAATLSSHEAMRHWLKGWKNVPPLKRQIISELLGLPEEELFPNTDNATKFIEYIGNLPNERNETIEKIETATRSTYSAVYQWVKGINNVPPLKKRIISKLIGLPEEELFPKMNKRR